MDRDLLVSQLNGGKSSAPDRRKAMKLFYARRKENGLKGLAPQEFAQFWAKCLNGMSGGTRIKLSKEKSKARAVKIAKNKRRAAEEKRRAAEEKKQQILDEQAFENKYASKYPEPTIPTDEEYADLASYFKKSGVDNDEAKSIIKDTKESVNEVLSEETAGAIDEIKKAVHDLTEQTVKNYHIVAAKDKEAKDKAVIAQVEPQPVIQQSIYDMVRQQPQKQQPLQQQPLPKDSRFSKSVGLLLAKSPKIARKLADEKAEEVKEKPKRSKKSKLSIDEQHENVYMKDVQYDRELLRLPRLSKAALKKVAKTHLKTMLAVADKHLNKHLKNAVAAKKAFAAKSKKSSKADEKPKEAAKKEPKARKPRKPRKSKSNDELKKFSLEQLNKRLVDDKEGDKFIKEESKLLKDTINRYKK